MKRKGEERLDWQKLKDGKVIEKYEQEFERLDMSLGGNEYGNDFEKLWNDSCRGI